MSDNNTKQEIEAVEEEQSDESGAPKFGRLLIVLVLVVVLIGFITFASEWLYS
ncbi:MAG: hypothetical protein NWQ13_10650 [Glaciimonas sp.]|nr:hypothetical protein [Glaciimonas sp.]